MINMKARAAMGITAGGAQSIYTQRKKFVFSCKNFVSIPGQAIGLSGRDRTSLTGLTTTYLPR